MLTPASKDRSILVSGIFNGPEGRSGMLGSNGFEKICPSESMPSG